MSDNAEHIDNFFKENIEQVNVQYNPAHWEKLQKALIAGVAVGGAAAVTISKWQAILKFLKLYKIYVAVVSVATVTTTAGIIYYNVKNNKQPQKNVEPVFKKNEYVMPPQIQDSIKLESDTPVSVNKNMYFKPNITTLSDTPKYVSPYSVDTTKKLMPFKKDTIISTKKDTVKKKNLNTFW